ncbi:MAG TPA: CocE/NonD family hydrolase [Nocardioides sp.]|nr:CocE/NonD family hydrolase [Nocardioides sp.]
MRSAPARSLAVLVAACLGLLALGARPAGADTATTVTETVRYTAPDGTSIKTVLTGAAPMASRPTVVEFTPYGAGGASYAVGPDYNYLLVEIRGTGDSDGEFDALGPQSQQDVRDVLSWACAQDWSDGSLAVAGFSASAIMIFNSLHLQLPCVKAAVLRSGTFELYRDLLVPGGIPNTAPGIGVLGLIGAPALEEGPERLQRNALSSLTTILGLTTAGLDAGLLHPALDSFWAERGFRGNANTIPTLFLDGAFDVEPRGDYQGFEELRREGTPTHLLVVGGHDGAPAGTDNGVAEIDRWLDHYVRGVSNGIDSEPAVQMLLADGDREDMLAGRFVRYDAADYPAPGTTWTPLALSATTTAGTASLNRGSLALTPDPIARSQSYPAVTSLPTNTDPNTIATVAGGDGGWFNELASYVPALSDMDLSNLTGLTYTSPPLRAPVTAAGPADLDLRLSSVLGPTNIWAVISDVSPDGHAHPMAVGRLNTSFPGIVAARSLYSEGRLVQPYGDYSTPSPALPLLSRMYHVEFWPISNRFEAGHRIQLSILGQSALSMPALPSLNTVTLGGGSGSRLMFPAAPGENLSTALGG